MRPRPDRQRRLLDRLDRLDPPTDPTEIALMGRSPVDDPASLIGLGPGFTPAGDDLVAGTLVGLHALGRARAAADLVGRIDVAGTTPISAALLVEAGRGRAARPLLGLVRALGGAGELDAAIDALLDVGATSGRWLADGLRCAITES